MQPGLLFQFNGSLRREEQQSPEHSHPVTIQIGGSHRSPALNKLIEINPVQSIVPSVQKDTECCRCLGKFFPMSEICNLGNRFTVAVALASLATPGFQIILFKLLGDRLQLFDQLPQGDGPFQGGRRHRPSFEMTLRPSRQVETRIQP